MLEPLLNRPSFVLSVLFLFGPDRTELPVFEKLRSTCHR